MATWITDELSRTSAAEEVRIAALRTDGTLRKPVIVRIVRAGDDLYARSFNGRNAAWFRGVQARHEGSLQAAGVAKDVEFVEVADNNQGEVDAGTAQVRALSEHHAPLSDVAGHLLPSIGYPGTLNGLPAIDEVAPA